jgi:hypothetical protein
MSDDAAPNAGIGMYVEIQRAIWPQLFDDLMRLPKGTTRVQRLRALAYLGLFAERRLLPEHPDRIDLRQPTDAQSRPPGGAEGIFDAPVTD